MVKLKIVFQICLINLKGNDTRYFHCAFDQNILINYFFAIKRNFKYSLKLTISPIRYDLTKKSIE